MNLKKICIPVIVFGFFVASCGSGRDRDNDSNRMDTTDYDRQNMPRDSVYPLDTAGMDNMDTM